MQLMKRESGMNNYQQSHKNHLTNLSINSFLRYARQHDICCTENKENNYIPATVDDVYISGVLQIQKEFREKGSLAHFKPPVLFDQEMTYRSNVSSKENESDDGSGDSETGDERETSNEDSSNEDSSNEDSSKEDSSEENSEHS